MKPEERDAVIEECAKVCERQTTDPDSAGERAWDVACVCCAGAIRALTAQSPAGVPPEPQVDKSPNPQGSLVDKSLDSQGVPPEPTMARESWVSMADRTPSDEGEVLVYVPGAKYNKVDLDAWRLRSEAPVGFSSITVPIGYEWDNHEYEDVTHWMPLPQAPNAADAAGVPTPEPVAPIAREPTPRMILAGATALYGEESARQHSAMEATADCWYAMYDAAPQAPAEPVAQGEVQPYVVRDGTNWERGFGVVRQAAEPVAQEPATPWDTQTR